jgi:hypothetical protein
VIVIPIVESKNHPPTDPWGATHRRHYRGRNRVAAEIIDWNSGTPLPADPIHWDDMFGSSVRVGIMAAKKTFKPAVAVWVTMAGIAALYYLAPITHVAFAWLVDFQKTTGVWFTSIGMGLCVGILVEVVKVLTSGTRKWTRANTINALFNFAVFGLMGWTHHYRYAFQNEVFGAGNSLRELASKVAFDQFVWTVIIANPYQAVCFLWKNNHFSFKAVRDRLFPFRTFWGTQMLPVLISNWAFWIPMAFIIYYFPPDLQLPLSILAVTTWVMLLSVLTSMNRREEA